MVISIHKYCFPALPRLDSLTVLFAISIMYVILMIGNCEVLKMCFLSLTPFSYDFYYVILQSVRRLL